MNKINVTRIWLSGHTLFAESENGDTASYDLSVFKGFRNATPSQIDDFKVIGGKDIYWPQLDEDINLEGLFFDNNLCQLTPSEDSVVYRPLHEDSECVAEPLQLT